MSGLNALPEHLRCRGGPLPRHLLLIAILGVLAGMRAGWQKAIGSVTQLVAVFGALCWRRDRSPRGCAMSPSSGAPSRRAGRSERQCAGAGSPLACLDALVGRGGREPCEKAMFANPESAAAAVSLRRRGSRCCAKRSRMRRDDPFYGRAIADLRRVLEPDRFGFVAQALASGEQCKPDCHVKPRRCCGTRIASRQSERPRL